MLIYLDTMIVQYCADYEGFIFGKVDRNPARESKLAKELSALRRLVELEQLGNWDFAASTHLMDELLSGKPTSDQKKVYAVLLESWQESGWIDIWEAAEDEVAGIDLALTRLKLKDAGDRRNLAEAIAIEASWFLTNDEDIIRKTRNKPKTIGQVKDVWVARPSECIEEISIGLFLR